MRVVGGRLALRANAVPLIVSYAIHFEEIGELLGA